MVCRSSCAESQRNQVLFQKDPEASDSRDARGIPSDKSFSVTNEVCFGRLLPLLLRRREQSREQLGMEHSLSRKGRWVCTRRVVQIIRATVNELQHSPIGVCAQVGSKLTIVVVLKRRKLASTFQVNPRAKQMARITLTNNSNRGFQSPCSIIYRPA
jgi:hypothetical protein